MRQIIIDIDCDTRQCGECQWKRYLHPKSIYFFRCDLFNLMLGHDYDNGKLVCVRCQECLDREVKS